MFPYTFQDDQAVRPLSDEDQQVLMGLVRRYGLSSLANALSSIGTSCKFRACISSWTELRSCSPGFDFLCDDFTQ